MLTEGPCCSDGDYSSQYTKFLLIMVDTPASNSEPTAINISIVTQAGAIGKGKKQMKDIKVNILNHSFLELKENYWELLTAILQKHHVNKKYKVTSCNIYPCKIQAHPAKYVYLLLTIPVAHLFYDI